MDRAFDRQVKAVLEALQCDPHDVLLKVTRRGTWIAFCRHKRDVRIDLDDPTAHALIGFGATIDTA